MKLYIRNCISILIIFLSLSIYGQDTINKKDSIKNITHFYIRSIPVGLGTSSIYTTNGVSNTADYLTNRIIQNMEVGYSLKVLDIGITYGRLNIKQDSSSYIETRLTMVTCRIGEFSSEFSIGAGKSFNKSFPVMLEASSTILYQCSKYLGIGLIVGYFDFTGNYGDYSKEFYGAFFRIGLARDEGNNLLKRRSIIHRAIHR